MAQRSSVPSRKFAGILRLRTSMRASGGPARRRHASSDALLLVPPPPSPRRPDRQPAAACHNLLLELPRQDTSPPRHCSPACWYNRRPKGPLSPVLRGREGGFLMAIANRLTRPEGLGGLSTGGPRHVLESQQFS